MSPRDLRCIVNLLNNPTAPCCALELNDVSTSALPADASMVGRFTDEQMKALIGTLKTLLVSLEANVKIQEEIVAPIK